MEGEEDQEYDVEGALGEVSCGDTPAVQVKVIETGRKNSGRDLGGADWSFSNINETGGSESLPALIYLKLIIN